VVKARVGQGSQAKSSWICLFVSPKMRWAAEPAQQTASNLTPTLIVPCKEYIQNYSRYSAESSPQMLGEQLARAICMPWNIWHAFRSLNGSNYSSNYKKHAV
jgi:hypothetical protein